MRVVQLQLLGAPRALSLVTATKKATCVTKGVQMQRSEAEMIRSEGVSARRSAWPTACKVTQRYDRYRTC
jgi:hypothetical protein